MNIRANHLMAIIAGISVQQVVSQKIVLESDIIKIAGSFINADTIELMRKFRRKILVLLLGNPTQNGTRVGKYTFEGKQHSIRSLAQIEQTLLQDVNNKKNKNKWKKLQKVLIQAKADFIAISDEFLDNARGSKKILVILIEEDCKKRNRPDSLLLEWVKTGEGQEKVMFEKRIINFIRYYSLNTDLLNFLADLVRSCPKAEKQFEARVAKWSKVKLMLPEIMHATIPKTSIDTASFLKYLKENHLDKFSLQEITVKTMQTLLTEYIKLPQ